MSVYVNLAKRVIAQDGKVYKIVGDHLEHSEVSVPRYHYTLFGQIVFYNQVYFFLTKTQYQSPYPTRIAGFTVFPPNKEVTQALSYVRAQLYLVDNSPYQRFCSSPYLIMQPAVIGSFIRRDKYAISAILVSPLLTRFYRGLVDGVAANFIEMAIEYDKHRYVIARGSVPVDFKQPMTWKYTPKLCLPQNATVDIPTNQMPISLLNSTNFNQKRLNELYAAACPRLVCFDLEKKSAKQTRYFVAEFLVSTRYDEQQVYIPRINCLDCVDRTTKLVCEFAEQITNCKMARFDAYLATAALGALYVGTTPQYVLEAITGKRIIIDKGINGCMGAIRYVRCRAIQPMVQYYFDILNEKQHFVCDKPAIRLAVLTTVGCALLVASYFAGRSVLLLTGIVVVLFVC